MKCGVLLYYYIRLQYYYEDARAAHEAALLRGGCTEDTPCRLRDAGRIYVIA